MSRSASAHRIVGRAIVGVGALALALAAPSAAAAHTGALFTLMIPGADDVRFGTMSTTDASMSPLATNLVDGSIEPLAIDLIGEQGYGIGWLAGDDWGIFTWDLSTGATGGSVPITAVPVTPAPPAPDYVIDDADLGYTGLDAPGGSALLAIQYDSIRWTNPDVPDTPLETLVVQLVSIDATTGIATAVVDISAILSDGFEPVGPLTIATNPVNGVTEVLFPVEEGLDTVIVAMAIDRTTGMILTGPAPIPAFTTPDIQSVPFGSDFDPAGTLWLTIGEISDSGPAFSLVAIHGAPSDLSTVVGATTIGALTTPPWVQSFALAHDPAAVLPATGAELSPTLVALGAMALAGGGVLLTRASRAPRRPSSAR